METFADDETEAVGMADAELVITLEGSEGLDAMLEEALAMSELDAIEAMLEDAVAIAESEEVIVTFPA